MHQLTYTSCRPGMSLNGSGGYTVRAASPKLDQTWLAYAPHLARYEVSSSAKGMASARLAFHRRQNAALLTYSLSVRDHESRPASFTHAIIDPSGQLGPTEAISMWGSPFWKCADQNESTELPLLEALPVDGVLNSVAVQRHLQDGRFYAMAEFLLTAWLRRKDKSIVLIADAEKVAAGIWLIAHCLPLSAVRDLSFATHDHDPLTAGVAVVGCGSTAKSFPTAALMQRQWFDLGTGQNGGDDLAACVQFICREARAGNWQEVEAFATRCGNLHVDDLAGMDLVHRVLHESHLCTQEEIVGMQHRPCLLRWLLEDKRHAEVAVAILAGGPGAVPPSGKCLVGVLGETPERKQYLINALLAQAGAALASKDLSRAEYLLDLCAGTGGAPAPSALWQRTVEQVGIEQLATEVRIGLSERLVGLGAAVVDRSLVTRLLDVPLEALPVVLRCPARASVKAEACRAAVDRAGAMTQATIEALARQHDVLRQLLCIAANPTAIASVVAAHEPRAVLDILVADCAARNQVDIDAVLDHVLEAGTMGVQQLAAAGFSRYWGILLQGRHADRIVTAILSLSILQRATHELLDGLRVAIGSAPLSSSVAGALQRRIRLLEAFSGPWMPLASPTDVMLAVAELPQGDRRQIALHLLPRLAISIAAETTSTACRNLQALMALAVSQAHCGAAVALREVAKAALENGQLLRDATVATAAVAYAFGAIGRQPESAAERDQLVDVGVELTNLYARAGGPRLNRDVDEQAMCWPEPARALFRLARQQRRINGRLLAKFSRSRAVLADH